MNKEEVVVRSAAERIDDRWRKVQAALIEPDDDEAKRLLTPHEKPLEDRLREDIDNQIQRSRVTVDSKLHTSLRKMTDLVKEIELYEGQRREDYETKIAVMSETLASEKEKIKDLTTDLAENWKEIAKSKIPQELYRNMVAQKEEFETLLSRKKEALRKLEEYFLGQQEQYRILLKSQEEDVRNLLRDSQIQAKEIQETYDAQLLQVERSFIKERQALLEQYKEDREKIFKKRRDQELTVFDKNESMQDEFMKDLDTLKKSDSDKFKKMKQGLEEKIQVVVQDLQDVKAAYALNYEKLTYNHSVLKEREKDNSTTVTNQKKRFKRLKENLSNMKAKYEKVDGELKKENQVLREEYIRITKQYKELGSKFKHFKRTDQDKYLKIWNMNDQKVKDLLKQIAEADRVIHEQILQIPWKEFEIDARTPPHLMRMMSPNDFTATISNSGHRSCGSISTFSHSTHDFFSQFSNAQKIQMFQILVRQAHFLIDKSLEEKLRSIPEDQHLMYKVDSLFNSLGVEDVEEIDEILTLFFNDQGEIMVSENEIMSILQQYISNRIKGQDPKEKKSAGKDGQKHLRERSREKRYWQHMNKVISESKKRCWGTLKENLQQYHSLLQDRYNLLDKVDSLQIKNQELRDQLHRYMSSDVNKSLRVPPAAMMDFSSLH